MVLTVSASVSPANRSASAAIDAALYLLVPAVPSYVFDHPLDDERTTFTLNWYSVLLSIKVISGSARLSFTGALLRTWAPRRASSLARASTSFLDHASRFARKPESSFPLVRILYSVESFSAF